MVFWKKYRERMAENIDTVAQRMLKMSSLKLDVNLAWSI